MNIKIIPKPLGGRVNSISSKSHAHRLMIAAALCSEPCDVHISDMNEDLHATQNCLGSLNTSKFVCGESGSTLRFILPLAMVLNDTASFFGWGRLPERPLSPLKEEMENHGCHFTFSDLSDNLSALAAATLSRHMFTVTGRLTGGIFHLAGNVSSQYITGLLFALPLLKEESSIILTSKPESVGYIRLTLHVLKLFGIDITTHDFDRGGCCTFFISGGQKYISPGQVSPEGDWSNAAFWLVADALSSDSRVSCENLNKTSLQGDREIIDFIKAVQSADSDHTLVFDVANTPDLVPILAVLAASRKGIVEIVNAGRLRIKESDRLASVREMLEALGGSITELEQGLVIQGNGKLQGGTVNGYNDHRIVMAAAIASLLCSEPVTILGSDAVNKSYPKFFEDFATLGGEYYVL